MRIVFSIKLGYIFGWFRMASFTDFSQRFKELTKNKFSLQNKYKNYCGVAMLN